MNLSGLNNPFHRIKTSFQLDRTIAQKLSIGFDRYWRICVGDFYMFKVFDHSFFVTSDMPIVDRAAEVVRLLVTVGRRARWIGEEAMASGLPQDKVVMVDDAVTAVATLEELIEEKDVVLVKGSLGMRMEQIVNAIGRYN